MATVEFDKMNGSNATLAATGWEAERIAFVYGVTGDGDEKLYNAVTDPAMPSIGDEHPAIQGCLLSRIKPEAIDTTTVKCTLEYRTVNGNWIPSTETPTQIEVGAGLAQKETNKDINGNDLVVSYTYTEPQRARWGIQETEAVNQGGRISVLRPEVTLSVVKKLAYSPESQAISYVGKTNISSWRGYPANTWLCTNITGRSSDGGVTYDATYSFQYRASGWDETYVFILPDGNPPDVTDANSSKTSSFYSRINFGELGL